MQAHVQCGWWRNFFSQMGEPNLRTDVSDWQWWGWFREWSSEFNTLSHCGKKMVVGDGFEPSKA